MNAPDQRADTTQLLLAARGGDAGATSALFGHLYETLRQIARSQLSRAQGAALDTTELVHEAYLKLCDPTRLSARDREHFLALSARAMRQVLVDHFRARTAEKRGGPTPMLPLDDELRSPTNDPGLLILAVDRALERLASANARTAQLVELKFFGGLTEPEIAAALGISIRTVSSEWRHARAWLTRELEGR